MGPVRWSVGGEGSTELGGLERVVAGALGVAGTGGTGRPGVQGSGGGCRAAVLQSPALGQRAAQPLKGAAMV